MNIMYLLVLLRLYIYIYIYIYIDLFIYRFRNVLICLDIDGMRETGKQNKDFRDKPAEQQ